MTIRNNSLGLLAFAILNYAIAEDAYKKQFDEGQTERLRDLQRAMGAGEVDKLRSLAREQISSIDEQLKLQGTYGQHQRMATARYASALITQKIVDQLKSNQMYSGQSMSFIFNDYLKSNYGVELTYKEDPKNKNEGAWSASMAGDSKKLVETITSSLSGDEKKVWDALSDDDKKKTASFVVSELGKDVKTAIPKDDKIDSLSDALITKKAEEVQKKVDLLKKDLATAHFLDESEKRLLASEKKVTEAIRDGADSASVEKLCKEFAENLSNPEDLKRRLEAGGSSDRCKDSFDKRLAALKSNESTKPTETASREPAVEPTYQEGDDPSKEEKEGEGKSDKALAEAVANEKKAEDAAAQMAAMKQAMENLGQENEQLRQSLNFAAACQQQVNLPTSNGEGSSMMQQQISKMSDALIKKITDASVSMCEQGQSASQIVSTLVPYGPLTEADQGKIREATERFTSAAEKIASGRGEYNRIRAKIRAEAVAQALERIRVEDSAYINPSVVSHLKRLSYEELMTPDATGFSPLTKAASAPQAMAQLIDIFNRNFNSATDKLAQENGVDFDYDVRQQCALDLAKLSASRWSSEAGRSFALFGPARQAQFNQFRNLATMDVGNAPSSETTPKKTYKGR